MCSRSGTRTIAAVALLSMVLGGCSEYYFDRRDAVSLHSGDAVLTNRVTMMIDPWPAASGQRNIAYNGEKAATASERYRIGRIIPPVNATTSSTAYTQAAQQAQSTANNQANSAPNAGSNTSNNMTDKAKKPCKNGSTRTIVA